MSLLKIYQRDKPYHWEIKSFEFVDSSTFYTIESKLFVEKK